MTDPKTIVSVLWALGFSVELSADDGILVSPASTLKDEYRQILRANKAGIVEYLKANPSISDELIAAAMRVCDRHGDDEEARAEMVRDCLATPRAMQRDLLDHFTTAHSVATNS